MKPPFFVKAQLAQVTANYAHRLIHILVIPPSHSTDSSLIHILVVIASDRALLFYCPFFNNSGINDDR
jgi:hypothetical protein